MIDYSTIAVLDGKLLTEVAYGDDIEPAITAELKERGQTKRRDDVTVHHIYWAEQFMNDPDGGDVGSFNDGKVIVCSEEDDNFCAFEATPDKLK